MTDVTDATSAARAFQERGLTTDDTTLQHLFTEARTHYGRQGRDVSEETLREVYQIAKLGPYTMNQ